MRNCRQAAGESIHAVSWWLDETMKTLPALKYDFGGSAGCDDCPAAVSGTAGSAAPASMSVRRRALLLAIEDRWLAQQASRSAGRVRFMIIPLLPQAVSQDGQSHQGQFSSKSPGKYTSVTGFEKGVTLAY